MTVTDLYNHHHGQSISSGGRETAIERQPEKERLYTIGFFHKKTASKLFWKEELYVISALHINPIHHFITTKLVK